MIHDLLLIVKLFVLLAIAASIMCWGVMQAIKMNDKPND